MPRCLDLTRAVSAFAATSSASLAVLHQEQDRQRFCSALGPPRMRASRCSMIQASPTGILRAQRWHLPCSRSQTRSLTRAGTAVSSLAPTHAGTVLAMGNLHDFNASLAGLADHVGSAATARKGNDQIGLAFIQHALVAGRTGE